MSVNREGRRVLGRPCDQGGDIGEDLGPDSNVCVSECDVILVWR